MDKVYLFKSQNEHTQATFKPRRANTFLLTTFLQAGVMVLGKSMSPATEWAQGGFGFCVIMGEDLTGQQQALVPPFCPRLQPGSPRVRLTVLGSLRSPWARGVSHGRGARQSGQDPGPGVHPWWLGWGGCGRGHHTRQRQPMFLWLQKVLLGRPVPHSWVLGRRSADTLHESTCCVLRPVLPPACLRGHSLPLCSLSFHLLMGSLTEHSFSF